MNIKELIDFSLMNSAAELRLAAGEKPQIYIEHDLKALNFPKLESADLLRMLYSLMDPAQRTAFDKGQRVEFNYDHLGVKPCSIKVSAGTVSFRKGEPVPTATIYLT